MIYNNVIRVRPMLDFVGLCSWYSGRVKDSLVLPRAEWYHFLDHDRFQFLSFDLPSVLQARINGGSSAGCLIVSWMHHNRVHSVKIRIDHQRRSAAQVNVFLPPIRNVVTGPPRFQHQIALQFLPDTLFELDRQFFHSGIICVVQQRTDAS